MQAKQKIQPKRFYDKNFSPIPILGKMKIEQVFLFIGESGVQM